MITIWQEFGKEIWAVASLCMRLNLSVDVCAFIDLLLPHTEEHQQVQEDWEHVKLPSSGKTHYPTDSLTSSAGSKSL